MTGETMTSGPAAAPDPAVAVPSDFADAFPGVAFTAGPGYDVARVEPDEVVRLVTAARDAGYDYFVDLCAVDHLHRRPRRYQVVVNLVDPRRPARLLVEVGLEGPDPEMPTITGVFPGANAYEREAYDLFGIGFAGHPDLTRILLPDDWEGHPLRKDAPVGSVAVQFKEADS